MLLKNSDIIEGRRAAFLQGQPIPDTMSTITFDLWSHNSPHNVSFSNLHRHLMRVDKSLDGCLEDIFVLEKEVEKLHNMVDEDKRVIKRLERTVREKQEEVNASASVTSTLRSEVEGLKKRLDTSATEKELQSLKLAMAVQESKLRQFQKDHEFMEMVKEQLSGMEAACSGAASLGASSGVKRKSGE
jgi:predicted RNase H-like nuclease (RuvC/YqgF family)